MNLPKISEREALEAADLIKRFCTSSTFAECSKCVFRVNKECLFMFDDRPTPPIRWPLDRTKKPVSDTHCQYLDAYGVCQGSVHCPMYHQCCPFKDKSICRFSEEETGR